MPEPIRESLEAGRFGVQYEPLVEVRTAAPCAFEALARFHRPDGAVLDTAQVLGHLHAERPFFAEVELAMKDLQLSRAPRATLFVNVHPNAFAESGERGLGLLERIASQRDRVVVEVIENFGAVDAGGLRTMIRDLTIAGVPVALDDLGAPNALVSLESLLRVQYLKLDRSTLRAATDLRTRALLEALLGLARRLGVRTVLEGVEDNAGVRLAAELGVDLVQGYLFRDLFVHVVPRCPARRAGRRRSVA